MTALLGDFEHAGGISHFGSKVSRIFEDGCLGVAEFEDDTLIRAGLIVNSGGLGAVSLMHGTEFRGYQDRWAKGNYYSYFGPVPFDRLIYPTPTKESLGVHLTLDLSGRPRFGPDLEWVDELDYSVNDISKLSFHAAIVRYWPKCDLSLLQSDYSGIRPKISIDGKIATDYLVTGRSDKSRPPVNNLLGIESPGLTSCLAVANYVFQQSGI